MRIAFAIFFGIICLKLIFDLDMGKVTIEEQEMHAIIATFFSGLFCREFFYKKKEDVEKLNTILEI